MTLELRSNVLYALTWRVIAELMRRDARLMPLVSYPGLSRHGIMQLVRAHPLDARDQPAIRFNLGGGFFGALDIQDRNGNRVEKVDGWKDLNFAKAMLVAQDPAEVVNAVGRAAGLEPPGHLGKIQPAALCARVIARTLATLTTARTPVRTSAGYIDHQGIIAPCSWLAGVPELASAFATDPNTTWRTFFPWWIVHTGDAVAGTEGDIPGRCLAFNFARGSACVLSAGRTEGCVDLLAFHDRVGRRIAPLGRWADEQLGVE